MKDTSFLLYGSYGYTGKLIARLAVEQGLRPLLAGRNRQKLEAQARELGLPFRAFELGDATALGEALREAPLILHCAGPFAHTFDLVSEACLRTGTHYLDITGEWQVFEGLAKKNQRAIDAGVMLLPGVGFDVVPSDCLAAHLKSMLPDAQKLTLAIQALGNSSHGTATTAVENLGGGAMVRKGGRLIRVPMAHHSRTIDISGQKPVIAVTVPWGDVATSWYSTDIPDVEVLMSFPPKMIPMIKASRYLGWLLGSGPVQAYLKRQVKKGPEGPSEAQRAQGKSYLWGEVVNARGDTRSCRLRTPEGYSLTAQTALLIAHKVLAGDLKPGFQTPSLAYGKDLILEIEGAVREEQ